MQSWLRGAAFSESKNWVEGFCITGFEFALDSWETPNVNGKDAKDHFLEWKKTGAGEDLVCQPYHLS